MVYEVFFFNDTATTEIYTRKDTLSLHDALPISRTVLEQAVRVSSTEIESGTLSYRCCAVEDFELHPGEPPYDLVFAVRVGALDGRHPEATEPALRRIVAATAPGARLFIDGGSPLVEFAL